jgi:hypothetical protein
MKTPSRLTLAALAAFMLDAAATGAAVRPEPSPLALPSPLVAQRVTCRVPEAGEPASPGTPVTLVLAQVPAPASVEFSGVHYRPRQRGGFRRQPESAGVSQLHVGFFDPDGPQSARFDIGVRGGPMVTENLQFGLGVDWIHKGENVSSVTSSTVGPGGVPIEVTQDISRASVNMFPIMGFVQVSAPDNMSVVPYAGAGGGYQVLVLSGDDFTTGQSFEGTFSGWGWQVWGGVGLPLGGRTRLTGEVYLNRAELGRDANDVNTGLKVHETVNADGVGMRFGVAWGF